MIPQDKILTPQPDEPEQEAVDEQPFERLSNELFESDEFAAPPEDVYVNLPPCDVEGALELLRFLREEDDAEEQRETMEYLIRVLDEDRPSYRKLFPEELKGVTW